MASAQRNELFLGCFLFDREDGRASPVGESGTEEEEVALINNLRKFESINDLDAEYCQKHLRKIFSTISKKILNQIPSDGENVSSINPPP
ncbi:MAG: hypothetical protein ACTSRK_16190 [Promethearchaeota archaeon]